MAFSFFKVFLVQYWGARRDAGSCSGSRQQYYSDLVIGLLPPRSILFPKGLLALASINVMLLYKPNPKLQ